MMECNKEEAIRAKGLAEKKMEVKDFTGARKIALKAQKLFPDLDNISQMLMVCDIHCSAEDKVLGKEVDWYGILQIEPTADEATIKKQYRKFALQLHPDKNKFAGAEAAFKLIGEARKVLLDKGKRSLHDVMRRSSVASRPTTVPYQTPEHGSSNNKFGVQDNVRMKTPPQPGVANVRATFWTACPFCAVKFLYYKAVLGKHLSCQKCSQSFMAHDINLEGVPLGPRKDVPDQGRSEVEAESQGTSSTQNGKRESFPRTDVGSKKGKEKRKRRQDMESSESFDTRSSNGDAKEGEDQDLCSEVKSGFSGDQYVRRSNRQRQHVSYKENLRDDDQVGPPKRAKGSRLNCDMEGAETEDTSNKEELKMNKQSGSSAKVKEDQNGVFVNESILNGNKETKKENGNRIEKDNHSKKGSEVDINSESTLDAVVYAYPDPDFNDFDNIRKEECFECGQTWAVYDTVDAMPRFYAHIKKVLSPGFKLRITWLTPEADDEIGIQWLNKDLPVSCGKFRHGNSENTEDHLMFSHLVCCERGTRRNSYKIYPRKGETWALFKNWSTSWANDPDSDRKYDYEFVEILSEYVEEIGLTVAFLGKVKGFVSLFYRVNKEGTRKSEIPPSEFYRFSHKVPSFEMSGEEREGVPKGSYELDPASLPIITDEIDVPVNLKVGASNGRGHGQDDVKGTHLNSKEINSGNVVEDCCSPVASFPEAMEIPDPEFYDFDSDISPDKFQIGQFWALYSDEDSLPRYYGQVTNIDKSPDFKLHVTWLVPARCLPKDTNEDVLFGCGIFKLSKEAPQAYTCTSSFSHQLEVRDTAKRNKYAIFPKEHEVWALYKNWNANMTRSDLYNCEYEIVEILEDNDCRLKVQVLEHVSGYNSVFKARAHSGSTVTLELTWPELQRFSHQVPAFRLTHERGGKLRGCWELDPAALPTSFISN